MRRYSLLDKILIEAHHAAHVIHTSTDQPQRQNPANHHSEDESLVHNEARKRHTAALMRINHTGEVCAQALYRGQAFLAKSPETRAHLLQAAREEHDHLIWCQQRLQELAHRHSYLNFFWYSLSFKIGLVASLLGDDWSEGFVVETEHQVEAHLESHLADIPASDAKSRAILTQMKVDEIQHAHTAIQRGARTLPRWIKALMKLQSKVMTTTTYRI